MAVPVIFIFTSKFFRGKKGKRGKSERPTVELGKIYSLSNPVCLCVLNPSASGSLNSGLAGFLRTVSGELVSH